MTQQITLKVARAEELPPGQRAEIVDLCTVAYGENFDRLFDLLPASTHVLGRCDGTLVSHAAWVTRWLQPDGREPLRTAYVEAVATAPGYRRLGFATAVMKELQAHLGGYDLAALSPSDAAFYQPLGWELWRGPLAIRHESRLLPTPEEEVMILHLAGTSELDLSSGLTAEWRLGELW